MSFPSGLPKIAARAEAAALIEVSGSSGCSGLSPHFLRWQTAPLPLHRGGGAVLRFQARGQLPAERTYTAPDKALAPASDPPRQPGHYRLSCRLVCNDEVADVGLLMRGEFCPENE